jgi:hypothetical protein
MTSGENKRQNATIIAAIPRITSNLNCRSAKPGLNFRMDAGFGI